MNNHQATPMCDCVPDTKKILIRPRGELHGQEMLGVTEVKFCKEAEGEVCIRCGKYPYYHQENPRFISLNQITDAEFNQDLVEYIGNWEIHGDTWEDFGFGNGRKRKLESA